MAVAHSDTVLRQSAANPWRCPGTPLAVSARMAQQTAIWAMGIVFGVCGLTACGGSDETGDTSNASIAREFCSSEGEGEDSFDLSTAGADLTECVEDADCTVVELSSDCGNGCVAAVVSTSAAGGIVDELQAHPERRCSACAVLLEAGSELAIDTSCSAEAAPPACVDGRCRQYHTL